MTDEELSLTLGAPWGKEGMLERKHYWETPGKRSRGTKDVKNWNKVFAVVDGKRGEVEMFRFGDSTTTRGGGGGTAGRGVVGGGNWTVRRRFHSSFPSSLGFKRKEN
jgi:hypothetical protein